MQDKMDLTHMPTDDQWIKVSTRLREPFDPDDVDFRVQGRTNERTGRAQVVAYIDARAVQDRLDSVVGAGNWSFDWAPLVIENGEVMVAKGTLTIYGISKSDVGSASNFEQTLGTVSHCFKRAAVHWGIGRYLYNLPVTWVSVERGGRIPEPIIRELRAKLPKPQGYIPQKPEVLEERVAERGEVRTANLTPQPEHAISHSTVLVGHEDKQSVISEDTATERQMASIRKLCEALGKPEPEPNLTNAQARELITQLSAEYQRMRRAS